MARKRAAICSSSYRMLPSTSGREPSTPRKRRSAPLGSAPPAALAPARHRLPRLPAAPCLLPPRRGRRAHPGRPRPRGRRADQRGGRDRSGPALSRPHRRLPAQDLDRAVLRRRGETRHSDRVGTNTGGVTLTWPATIRWGSRRSGMSGLLFGGGIADVPCSRMAAKGRPFAPATHPGGRRIRVR